MSLSTPEIALIGGGTGSFTLLKELKEFTPTISAIVNMSDDGGSTGWLRDELGVLPPGDVRQCLVALSSLEEVRDLFSFRFGEGVLKGQSLGNVILSGLELQYDGDFQRAISMAGKLLDITGKVLPVTLEKHTLTLHDGDEVVMRGEYKISTSPVKNRDAKIVHEPAIAINPQAEDAIHSADLVVIAPGNVYGSLLPALAVGGMRQALHASAAKKIVVTNLVNKPGQTEGWHVVDYVKEFERYIGEDAIDYVLYNNQAPSPQQRSIYASEHEFPVDISEHRFEEVRARAIGAPLLNRDIVVPHDNDVLIPRTFIRHNGHLVGRKLMSLFYGE